MTTTTTESRPVERSLEAQAWSALLSPPGS